MFRRESEQSIKVNFKEKKERAGRKSLRSKLSSVSFRRKMEAVALAAVTIMASMSIDWSSLVGRAEGLSEAADPPVANGTTIMSVYRNDDAEDGQTTTIESAAISIVGAIGKTATVNWTSCQNLKDYTRPTTDDFTDEKRKVASGTAQVSIDTSPQEIKIGTGGITSGWKNITLLGKESAAVEFTVTISGAAETYTYNIDTSESSIGYHFTRESIGGWDPVPGGSCVKYGIRTTADSLETVHITGGVESAIAIKAGDSYTFDKQAITFDKDYSRTLKLKVKEDTNSYITPSPVFPRFDTTPVDGKNGETATVTIFGDGIEDKDVTVRIVTYGLKGTDFNYKGAAYTDDDIIKAACGSENVAYTSTYSGDLLNGGKASVPEHAGTYTVTAKGTGIFEGADWLEGNNTFKIDPIALPSGEFTSKKATIENGKITGIPDVSYTIGGKSRVIKWDKNNDGQGDYDAEITGMVIDRGASSSVTYTVTLTGKGDFKDTVDITGEPVGGQKISVSDIIDHIAFSNTNGGVYDGSAKDATVKIYGKNGSGEPVELTSDKFKEATLKPGSEDEYENGDYYITFTKLADGEPDPSTEDTKIVDAGRYIATIHGVGSYNSSLSSDVAKPYVVEASGLEPAGTVVTVKNKYFERTPNLVLTKDSFGITVKHGDTELEEGKDYQINVPERGFDTSSITGVINIVGINNYHLSVNAEYHVFPSLSSARVSLDGQTPDAVSMTPVSGQEYQYVWRCTTPQIYIGESIKPNFSVLFNGETITTGNGLVVPELSETPSINVTGTGQYAAYIITLPAQYAHRKIRVEFPIGPKPIVDNMLTLGSNSYGHEYSGKPVELVEDTDYAVKDGDKSLSEGTDYTVSYSNNTNAGTDTASITVTGTGNYSGSVTKSFSIKKINISDGRIKITIDPQKLNSNGTTIADLSQVHILLDGAETVTVNSVEKKIFGPDDFVLVGESYNHNENAFENEPVAGMNAPEVRVEGRGNLEGSTMAYFQIGKELLKGLVWKVLGMPENEGTGVLGTVSAEPIPTGFKVDYPKRRTPKIVLYYNDGSGKAAGLFPDRNYTREPAPIHAGTNTITIKGSGDYKAETYTFTYQVNKLSLEDCTLIQDDDWDDGEGHLKKPTLHLWYGNTEVSSTEYYVTTTADEAAAAGTLTAGTTYKAVFTAKNDGNYTGHTKELEFTIGTELNKDNVIFKMYGPRGTDSNAKTLTYFGRNYPYFEVFYDEDKDGVADDGEKLTLNTYAGTEAGARYTSESGNFNITFTHRNGSDDFAVGTVMEVSISPKAGSTYFIAKDAAEKPVYQYRISPVNAFEGTENNEDVSGNNYVTVRGNLTFYDTTANISTENIDEDSAVTGHKAAGTGQDKPLQYNFSTTPFTPELYVIYEPKFARRTSEDTAVADVYDSVLSKVTFRAADVFDGIGQITPSAVTVGTPTTMIALTGKGTQFTRDSGQIGVLGRTTDVYYKVGKASIADATVTLPGGNRISYTGSAIRPEPVVKMGNNTLNKSTDYTVKYYKINDGVDPDTITVENFSGCTEITDGDQPVSVGKYVVRIDSTDGGNYTGSKLVTYEIIPADIKGAFTIALQNPDPKDFTGSAITPGVVVLDRNGQDVDDDGNYQVTYENNINPGTAKAIITGLGSYAGSQKELTFKIRVNLTNTEFKDADLDDAATKYKKVLWLSGSDGKYYVDTACKTTVFAPKLYIKNTTVEIGSAYYKYEPAICNQPGEKLEFTIEKPANSDLAYGQKVGTFTAKYNLSTGEITGVDAQYDWTGSPVSPWPSDTNLTVRYNGTDINQSFLKFDADTTNTTDVGEKTFHFSGIDTTEKFSADTISGSYFVKYNLAHTTMSIGEETAFLYTGKPRTFSLTVHMDDGDNKLLVAGEDYTPVFDSDSISLGSHIIKIEPYNNVSYGTNSIEYSISKNPISNGNIVLVDYPENGYEYDGNEKKPKVKITMTNTGAEGSLVEGTDYTLDYENNKNASTAAKVIIRGKGAYAGNAITKLFTINPKSITGVSCDPISVYYAGDGTSSYRVLPKAEDIKVTDGGLGELRNNVDYEIIWDAEDSPDTDYAIDSEHYVKIKGKGNYDRETTKEVIYKIVSASVKGAAVSPSSFNAAYGDSVLPETVDTLALEGRIRLSINTDSVIDPETGQKRVVDLVYGSDYTLSLKRGSSDVSVIDGVGEYTVVIKGIGNYSDEKTIPYTVSKRSLAATSFISFVNEEGRTVSSPFDLVSGRAEPKVKFVDYSISGGYELREDTDYTLTYRDNNHSTPNGTTAAVIVTGIGNYSGTVEKRFSIGRSINDVNVDARAVSASTGRSEADYTGNEITDLVLTVTFNGTTATENDYYARIVHSVTGSTTIKDAGVYVAQIEGKGNYYDTLIEPVPVFTIHQENGTSNFNVEFKDESVVRLGTNNFYYCYYDGSEKRPAVKVTPKGGTAPLRQSGAKTAVEAASDKNSDYWVEYKFNKDSYSVSGQFAQAVVHFINNYAGTAAPKQFLIKQLDISSDRFALTFDPAVVFSGMVMWTGKAIAPTYSLSGTDADGNPVTLYSATADDLSETWSNNRRPGLAKLSILGKRNIKGSIETSFGIYSDMMMATVTCSNAMYKGVGKETHPNITVAFGSDVLEQGTDYETAFESTDNWTNSGVVRIYPSQTLSTYVTGDVQEVFRISNDMSALILKGFSKEYVYSGSAAGPAESALTVVNEDGDLVADDAHVTATFASSVDGSARTAANATVTITTKITLDNGSVVAGPTGKYTIVPRNISSCTVKRLESDYYTGRALTPPVSVTYNSRVLSASSDYTLVYSNNTNPGTAVIDIRGKGNYTGSTRLMFTIKVMEMASVTARKSGNSVNVSWTARPHVTGYRVLYNTNGINKTDTTKTSMTLTGALPSTVGVQAYVKDAAGNYYYGLPKYVAVTN